MKMLLAGRHLWGNIHERSNTFNKEEKLFILRDRNDDPAGSYGIGYFGIYKKGKTFFLISASNKTEQGRKEVESFCKALGVVSPFTAKA